MAAAPCVAASGASIQPILEYIKIQRAEISGGEVIDRAVDLVKLESVIPGAAAVDKIPSARQDPTVDVQHLLDRNRVAFGIEIVQITKSVAQSIA